MAEICTVCHLPITGKIFWGDVGKTMAFHPKDRDCRDAQADEIARLRTALAIIATSGVGYETVESGASDDCSYCRAMQAEARKALEA